MFRWYLNLKVLWLILVKYDCSLSKISEITNKDSPFKFIRFYYSTQVQSGSTIETTGQIPLLYSEFIWQLKIYTAVAFFFQKNFIVIHCKCYTIFSTKIYELESSRCSKLYTGSFFFLIRSHLRFFNLIDIACSLSLST